MQQNSKKSGSSGGGFIANFGSSPFLIPALGAIVFIWWGVVAANQLITDNNRLDASQDAANVARVFEEHVARAIRETDKTLLFLRAIYQDRSEDFSLARWTNEKEFKSELVVQFAQIDANGMMVQSNVGTLNKKVDLSDREHFKAHLDTADDRLFISRPMLGRVSSKWSIQLSRRLSARDGSFAGVIVGSIDPAFLAKFYEGIELGAGGMTTLVGYDGIVRAGSSPSCS